MLRALRAIGDTSGQTLAEYALLITIVAVGVTVAAIVAFSAALGDAFDAVTGCIGGTC